MTDADRIAALEARMDALEVRLKHAPRSTTLVRPSAAEVSEYCIDKQYSFDPLAFVSYYESNGWKIGGEPMRSWKAACSTWHLRQQQPYAAQGVPRPPRTIYTKSEKP